MTTIGTIELFYYDRNSDGRLVYRSKNNAYQLTIPVNDQTAQLSFRIEIRLQAEEPIIDDNGKVLNSPE